MLKLRTQFLYEVQGYGYIRRKRSEHAGTYALFFRALVPLRVRQARAGFRRI